MYTLDVIQLKSYINIGLKQIDSKICDNSYVNTTYIFTHTHGKRQFYTLPVTES